MIQLIWSLLYITSHIAFGLRWGPLYLKYYHPQWAKGLYDPSWPLGSMVQAFGPQNFHFSIFHNNPPRTRAFPRILSPVRASLTCTCCCLLQHACRTILMTPKALLWINLIIHVWINTSDHQRASVCLSPLSGGYRDGTLDTKRELLRCSVCAG